MVFEKPIYVITDPDYPSNLRNSSKNLEATVLFLIFFKAFDSIHRGKIEQYF